MEKFTKQEISVQIGLYRLTVLNLNENTLRLNAYSEEAKKLFSQDLQDSTLSKDLKAKCHSCRVLFGVIEEAAQSNMVAFHEGRLKVNFLVKVGKSEVASQLEILLEEQKVDEVMELRIKLSQIMDNQNEMKQMIRAQHKQIASLKKQLADAKQQKESSQVRLKLDEAEIGKEFGAHIDVGLLTVQEPRSTDIELHLSKVPLSERFYFEIIVHTVGNLKLGIGISSKDNRVLEVRKSAFGTIQFNLQQGSLTANMELVEKSLYVAKEGDRLRVTTDMNSVIWECISPRYLLIGRVAIPEKMLKCSWLPYACIHRGYFGALLLI